MTDKDFKTYMHNYNEAVNRYSAEQGITPEEVVDLISIGELSIK